WPLASSTKSARPSPRRSSFTPLAGSSSKDAAFFSSRHCDQVAWSRRWNVFPSDLIFTSPASKQQMVQTRQPHRLAAGKWLGMLDPDHLAPEPGAIADRVNHSRLSGRLVVHQLRSIAPDGLILRLELVGNVDQQAGTLDDSQVHAEVVENSRRMERHPGDV